jgi:hypothetical protein
MRDYCYCVRPVGYITTYPGYGGSSTTEPFEQTPSTPLPKDPVANYLLPGRSFPLLIGRDETAIRKALRPFPARLLC